MKKILVTFVCLLPVLYAAAQAPAAKAAAPAAQQTEKHEATLMTAPDVAADAVLEAIVEQFKGKPLFVDFWATWCGPCVKGMETLKPLKPEIKAKGVQIIYITGETSPTEKFAEMMAQIGGVHYRLTNAQWKAVCDKYDIKGIPCYMVFDKQGNKTYQKMGYPGNDAILEELGKVW